MMVYLSVTMHKEKICWLVNGKSYCSLGLRLGELYMNPIPFRRMEAMYFVVVNSYFALQILRRGFNGRSLYLYLYICTSYILFIFEACM